MNFVQKVQNIIGNFSILKLLDGKLCNNALEELSDPIFIIGVPRVGSTLLYQGIIAKYKTAYLTNLHSLFYSEICLADYLVRFLKLCRVSYRETFQSRYGFSRGLLGPSEAGPTFRYWFGEADFNKGAHYTDCLKIRQTLATLCFSENVPFVSKNLFNSMRLIEIGKCFPGVFIVWVRRDREEVVRSILKMRRKFCGNEKRWISVKIPQWQEILDLPPEMQVKKQVSAIEEYIGRFIAARDEKLSISVDYKELCRDPESVIDRIMSKYSGVVNKDIRIRNSFSRDIFKQIRRE